MKKILLVDDDDSIRLLYAYETYKNNMKSIDTDFLVKKSSDLTEF